MNTIFPDTQYTKDVFRRMVSFVDGVLPREMQDEISHALEHVVSDTSLTREDIEDTMIQFGKRIWPYRKALQEAMSLHEGVVGMTFFRGALSRGTRKHCDEFFAHGGTIGDLRSGAPAHVFSQEERVELNHVLVNMDMHIKAFTIQSIKGTGRAAFAASVESFRKMFATLEGEIQHLEGMTDDVQQHPLLAREIREHIRGFEYGLVCLGKEYSHESLKQSHDHFHGRRRELGVRMR